MSEKTYILGSDLSELERLQFQHKVWSREAFSLWERSGISLGHHVLDLGCGPGFASIDLASIVGPEGHLTGVDKTPEYVGHAKQISKDLHLNHTVYINADFDEMKLPENSFDFAYSRWVFSWLSKFDDVISKVKGSLKTGGKFLLQEYLHWATLEVYPKTKEVDTVIEACRRSWMNMPSEINIGPVLVEKLKREGFQIDEMRPLPKIGRSKDLVWQWPGTFLKIYSLKLIEQGLLTEDEREAFLPVWEQLESNHEAFLVGPLMMEIVATKL